MKKFITAMLIKKRKGDGSSSSSHHSESRSNERVEEKQLHTLDPFILADRILAHHDNLLLTHEEIGKLYTLRTCGFNHTAVFDEQLLGQSGMSTDFPTVFYAIGWGRFWQVLEFSIKVISREFLATLKSNDTGVTFHMFNKDNSLTWSELSTCLGFDQDCELDIDHALQNFDLAKFWKLITCSSNLFVRRPVQIHNPTLRFMYIWIIVTLFSSPSMDDIGCKELLILYAMVNKIKFSPVKWLVPF